MENNRQSKAGNCMMKRNPPLPLLIQGGDKWRRPSTGDLPSLARRGGAERRGGCGGNEIKHLFINLRNAGEYSE